MKLSQKDFSELYDVARDGLDYLRDERSSEDSSADYAARRHRARNAADYAFSNAPTYIQAQRAYDLLMAINEFYPAR